MKKLIILFILICCYSNNVFSINIDSLKSVWNDASLHDTIRLDALQKVAWNGHLFRNADSGYYYAKIQENFARERGWKSKQAEAFTTIGVSFSMRNMHDSSIYYFQKCKNLREELGNRKGVATCLNNIGKVYFQQGNHILAINNYMNSLAIKEDIGDEKGVGISLNNIGNIYFEQKDYVKALEFFRNGKSIFEMLNEQSQLAMTYNNIGICFNDLHMSDSAIYYLTKALGIKEKENDYFGMSSTLNNLGKAHFQMDQPKEALAFYQRSLKIREDLDDALGLSSSYFNIGDIYYSNMQYHQAIDYGLLAMKFAKTANSLRKEEDVCILLYKSYKELGKNEQALSMYERYIELHSKRLGEEGKRQVLRHEYKYKYEKKTAADSIKNAEAQKVTDALLSAEQAQNKQNQIEAKQQKQQMYFLFGGLGLAILFGGFIFNRFRVTNKQKSIIEEQKVQVDEAFDELEEKNTEIMDSINYAKRIQSAILPPTKVVKEYLQNSFILYKPKDIVAGDFYWMERKDENILFAAADCTGHGVPGAMVSVICNNGLNRSVREHGLSDPGKILDKTREIVIQEFEKSEDEVKDGMDIALCSLSGSELKYAGAHNPLWIIRNGEIIETKANKQPIGKFDKQKPYTTHTFELQKNDTVYIFSDGYVDQFGGDKGKKFKTKAFKELLLSIQDKEMEDQKLLIDEAFENWKGSLEQIDDVCVIGVRV